MCLFYFVLKIPPSAPKTEEKDQTNENTVFPLPVLKVSSRPLAEPSVICVESMEIIRLVSLSM